MSLKAPFPYFGGKAQVTGLVWQRLGDVPNYVEPFFGSGAVLLARPHWPWPDDRIETVNDADGLLCNFWRAVRADPAAVAHHADWPVSECDLHARHAWLVSRRDSLQARLEGDPEFYDAKIAGWWVWGLCNWIGGGWCSGQGPWQVQEVDGQPQLIRGVPNGQGVQRRRVHLGNPGRGVLGQGVSLGAAGAGDPGTGECGLLAWMEALAARLRRVRVPCGDWSRVCTPATTTGCWPVTGVFLDPPYAAEAGRDPSLYRVESATVAHGVRAWALEHGDDPRLRIVLCGYEGEHTMPDTWECVPWKASGGYGNQGDNRGKANAHRERLWFSPHCLRQSQERTLFDNLSPCEEET